MNRSTNRQQRTRRAAAGTLLAGLVMLGAGAGVGTAVASQGYEPGGASDPEDPISGPASTVQASPAFWRMPCKHGGCGD